MLSSVGCISEFAYKLKGKSRSEIIDITKNETKRAVPKRMYRYILDLIDFRNLMQNNIVSRTQSETFWRHFIPVIEGLIENGEKVEDFPYEIRTLYIRESGMIKNVYEKQYDYTNVN